MISSLKEIITENIRYFFITRQQAKAAQIKKHKGTDLGLFWEFAKPVFYICVFYFAISMGFRGAKDVPDLVCPYFVWMASGIIPWFYITAMISGGPGCIKKYRGLVLKTAYPLSTIPTITSLANLYTHIPMVIFLLVLSTIFRTPPSIYWLQLPIYMALVILMGFVWALGSGLFSILSRDFRDLIRAISPAFFWLSGILFDYRIVDNPTIQFFFKLNPITYIVQGYRNCICFHKWIWEEPEAFLGFMVIFVILLVLALWLYKKLKNILPDII